MKLLDCSYGTQKSIKQKYVMPTDLSSVYVQNKLPYQLIGNCKVALNVKLSSLYGGGFHTSGSLNQ